MKRRRVRKQQLANKRWHRDRTDAARLFRATLSTYTPERVEMLNSVIREPGDIRELARCLAAISRVADPRTNKSVLFDRLARAERVQRVQQARDVVLTIFNRAWDRGVRPRIRKPSPPDAGPRRSPPDFPGGLLGSGGSWAGWWHGP